MGDTPSSRPGQPPGPGNAPEPPASPPVVVKKYANRRLYNTETSSYITLDNLAEMIRAGRDFVVYDAKSAEDITRGVLTQIIVEEESKGSSMLPTAFLRQLIGFYGGSLQGVVPRYLEHVMSSFARQQQQIRQMMQQTLSPFLPTGVEEMSRQNIAMFERAISLWNPFHRSEPADEQPEQAEPSEPTANPSTESSAEPSAEQQELERLRSEVASLRQQLAAAHAQAVAPSVTAAPPPSQAPANVLADPPADVPRGDAIAAESKSARKGRSKPGPAIG